MSTLSYKKSAKSKHADKIIHIWNRYVVYGHFIIQKGPGVPPYDFLNLYGVF